MTAVLRRYNTVYNLVSFSLLQYAADCPFPQIDIIAAMVIVWRVRGENSQVCSLKHFVQQLCIVQCKYT